MATRHDLLAERTRWPATSRKAHTFEEVHRQTELPQKNASADPRRWAPALQHELQYHKREAGLRRQNACLLAQLAAIRSVVEQACCPITQCAFVDPVVAADGQTYERAEIRTWLSHSRTPTSPNTNLPLTHTQLVTNYLAKHLLEEIGQALAVDPMAVEDDTAGGDPAAHLCLIDMGFDLDSVAAAAALDACEGDLSAVVEQLLRESDGAAASRAAARQEDRWARRKLGVGQEEIYGWLQRYQIGDVPSIYSMQLHQNLLDDDDIYSAAQHRHGLDAVSATAAPATTPSGAHAVDERQVFVPATGLVPQWQQPVSVMAPMTRADDDDELTSFFAPPLPSESRFLGRFEISAPPTMLNA